MIAKIVRDLRKEKGLSSNALALKIGMNRAWVSQIETGKIKHPHLPAFKKLLRALGLSERKIEEIILKEFPESEMNSHSSNAIDYRLERTYILSKQNEVVNRKSDAVTIFDDGLLTKESFKKKCQADAQRIFEEINELPKETLECLTTLIFDDYFNSNEGEKNA